MTHTDMIRLADSLEWACHKCSSIAERRIGGKQHNSPVLYMQLVKFFMNEPSAESVVVPVVSNLCKHGTATIRRNGYINITGF